MIVLTWIVVFILCFFVIIIGRIAGYYEHVALVNEAMAINEAAAKVTEIQKELASVKAEKVVDRGQHQVIYLNDPKAAATPAKPTRRRSAADSFYEERDSSLQPVKAKVDADRIARQKAIDDEFDRKVAAAARQLEERDKAAAEASGKIAEDADRIARENRKKALRERNAAIQAATGLSDVLHYRVAK